MSTTMRRMGWFPRSLGVATGAYSLAIIARPELFAHPTGITDREQAAGRETRLLVRAIGGRDLATGLAMAVAPSGSPLRTAIAVRVGADIVDLVALGSMLPEPTNRRKAVAVASVWGALCAASWLVADER